MFILIPSLLIAAGVALAARVVYKKIPGDQGEWDKTVAAEDFGPTFYQKALAAASLKTKQAVLSASTKLVYKLKITSLKSDNFFNQILKEMRKQKSDIDDAPESAAVSESSLSKNNQFRVQVTSVEERPPAAAKTPTAEVKPEEPAPEERSSFAAQEHQLINQLAYNPKDVSAYKHLGWLYMENNKPIEARQAFKMAIKLGSRDKIIMAKLLEVGGVLHKEGTASHTAVRPGPVVLKKIVAVEVKASVPASTVLTQKSGVKTKKVANPKTRKLKVRKV